MQNFCPRLVDITHRTYIESMALGVVTNDQAEKQTHISHAQIPLLMYLNHTLYI